MSAFISDQLRQSYTSTAQIFHCILPLDTETDAASNLNQVIGLDSINSNTDLINLIYGSSMAKTKSLQKLPDCLKEIGRMACDFTSGLRFNGQNSMSFQRILQQFSPFVRLHFLSAMRICPLDKSLSPKQVVDKITSGGVSFGGGLDTGKIMTSYNSFRGEFDQIGLNKALKEKLSTLPFCDFSQTCGVYNNYVNLAGSAGNSVLQLVNHTKTVTGLNTRITACQTLLQNNDPIIQTYFDDGFDQMSYSLAESNLNDLISEYSQYEQIPDDGG